MSQSPGNARRSFFAVLGGAAAVGIAAKLVPRTVVPDAAESAKPLPDDGYRLTEHIKKYYRTASL